MKARTKAQDAFHKWFNYEDPQFEIYDNITDYFDWDKLPDSMKWGVLVDFYDSVGIHINIIYECSEEDCYYYFDGVFVDKYDIGENEYSTRQEARKQALIKAESIYNEL